VAGAVQVRCDPWTWSGGGVEPVRTVRCDVIPPIRGGGAVEVDLVAGAVRGGGAGAVRRGSLLGGAVTR
jgi:hypothetical protein